jgi:PPP family 3-phenylpropionic acid transporter
MKKIWPFSFYFLYFAAFASFLPFIVLFYQKLQFNGTQIGLLTGIPPLITLIGAPFFTVADRTHRHRLIMGLGLAVAVGISLLLPHVSSFAVVFALIIIFNIFMSPVASLSDSATMTMLGEEKAMYGRIRMGGTFGWGMFALISGALVENQGLQIAFRLFAVIMFINLLVSQKFSFGNKEGDIQCRRDKIFTCKAVAGSFFFRQHFGRFGSVHCSRVSVSVHGRVGRR